MITRVSLAFRFFLLITIVASLYCTTSLTTTACADEPQVWVKENLAELIDIYRHFHAHPELSFKEKETAIRLGKEWESIGAKVTLNVGGFGVVGILKNGEGPTLMLRTDLDALPVVEQTGLTFSSQVQVKDENENTVGVMHACGHDVHMTNLIGVARYMAANKDRWHGTLMMIGQPAEERGAGAKAMLEDGLFDRFPQPDVAIALHVDSTTAAGKVGVLAGYSLANVDSVDVTMQGRGGHGAQPHSTIDPVVQAASFIVSVQTIVSREIKPIEPAVITVGSIHGGTKHNIIGDSCHMQLTVRSYSEEVRQKLLAGIRRKAKAVAMGAGAEEPIIKISEGTPSLRNDDDVAAKMADVFRKAIGESNVYQAEPSMGGEDFSRYGRAGVPILMYRLGAVSQRRLDRYRELGQPAPSLHSPIFYPDVEETLATGLLTMTSAALEILK